MKLTFADLIFWVIVLAMYAGAYVVLRRWRQDIVYIGYIGLATAGFFWRVLFAGAFIPAGGGDMAAILYPVYHFAQENLRQGVIPLWNPYLYAGIPFVGHIQSGPFYPPNLLLFFATQEVTYRSLEYLLIAHFWLAGVLMYVMLRNLHYSGAVGSGDQPARAGSAFDALSRPAALLGALVFMFNDFNITHVGNPNMVAVGAWLPLTFLLFHHALARHRIWLAMLAGTVTGIAYLAGHIQPFLYILFAVGLYALYFALSEIRVRRTPAAARASIAFRPASLLVRTFAYLVVFILFTVAISGISLLPNLEMSSQSLRESLAYGDAARFSLPPAEMVGLLIPALFGRGPDIHWGAWERVEVGYVGILPLVLAALAMIWRRERLPRYFVLLAFVSLALAMGLYSVVHGWLFLVPGYSQIRVPARFVFLLDFALAALAAYGFDALLHPLPVQFRAAWRQLFPILALMLAAVAFIVVPMLYVALSLNQSQDISIFNRSANALNGAVLFAILLAGSLLLLLSRRTRWLNTRSWTLAMVAFVFFDLAALGAYLDMGETDPSANFRHPQAFARLTADQPFRIETPEDSWFEWQPNLGLVAHLEDAAGIYNPLLLQRYDRYWKVAVTRDNTLYDLMNAKYLVTQKGATPAGKFTLAFDGDASVSIWQNQKSLPRAFMVYQSTVVANGDEAFNTITANVFDPMQSVVLEGGEALRSAAQTAPTVRSQVRGTNYVILDVTTDTEGYLFVGETYYPGWHAMLDGIEVPLLRADYLFRAAKVPAGTHYVMMVFDPWSWKIGVALSLLGLISLTVGWWIQTRRATSEAH